MQHNLMNLAWYIFVSHTYMKQVRFLHSKKIMAQLLTTCIYFKLFKYVDQNALIQIA